MSPPLPPLIARRVGRYVLAPPFASGGTATVHAGRLLGDEGFSRVVAVKRLRPQLADDPAFAAMLLDEARLAARVRHPNVVAVLDVVRDRSELLLVLEYVQGESLGRLLHRSALAGGRPSAPIVVAVMAAVLHGLHAAHEARGERGEPLGIVHRDVSPQNILLGVDGVARVCDFGIAKAIGRAQTTRDGQLKGKLAYMAPEQLCEGEVGRRADVYAASVVLWEALTARRLFAAESEGAIVHQILRGGAAAPSTHAPGLPPALDEIVRRGLATDPAGRFATARAMALALEEVGEAWGAAPASSIGAWVERTAGADLAARAAQIAALEARSVDAEARHTTDDGWPGPAEALEPTASDVDAPGPPRAPGRGAGRSAAGRRRAAGALVAAASLAALALALADTVRGHPSAPAIQSASGAHSAPAPPSGDDGARRASQPEVATPVSPDPAAAASGRADAAMVTSDPTAAASGRAGAVATPKPAAKPRQAGQPAPRPRDCDPPYVQGADGQKHFRRECFGR